MFKTNKNKQHGFTLVEMLVVIGIMALLMVMAIPFDFSYRTKAELKQSTKQFRALFWEAQSRALAPSSQYATSYKVSATKNSGGAGGVIIYIQECQKVPPAITETCLNIAGPQEQVALGTNIIINDIKLDGTSIGNTVTIITSFLVGNGRTAGQISFQGPPVTNQNQMDIVLGSKLDATIKYDIIVDIPTTSITYK